MKLTGAQIIVETLIEQGVDTVFGYPGGMIINVYDALYLASDRIRHIITAHEQGAAHAADGYARASGKVGVCMATSGPGATNLVTGIATAFLDSTPLVAITGNVPCALIGRDSFQEVDIVGVTMPITKHNYIVKDVHRLADTIREAFAVAQSGRPGPVLVDVPKDVQIAQAEWECIGPAPKLEVGQPKEKRIARAAELIAHARRPYIYCGGGVISGGASAELLAFAAKIDAPIGCSMMGLSAVPYDYPLALGMQGMHGRYASSKALAEADLILAVGARFSDRATGNKEVYAAGARIIHIDIDPAELHKNINAHLGITGDVKAALQALLDRVEETKRPAWAARIRELRFEESTYIPANDAFSPYNLIDTVKAAAPDEALIVTDVGQHQMWTAQRYDFKYPRCFITSGGLGTMGFGLGAAIGSSMATGRRAILFTGDGSFGMNLNELATAVKNRIPVTIIILNNGVLGMVRQWQNLFFDQHYSQTTLERQTDFVAVAEAFGAKGYRADNLTDFHQVLEAALAAGGPTVIDCHIDMDEMVLPMTPPGGSIDDIILELDREDS